MAYNNIANYFIYLNEYVHFQLNVIYYYILMSRITTQSHTDSRLSHLTMLHVNSLSPFLGLTTLGQ